MYTYKPKTKEELREIIKKELVSQGADADLNFIDVSEITDMSDLFDGMNIGNIKIDQWDVSNVTNMCEMFWYAENFNSDISMWDVSNVTNMSYMFCGAKSFNGKISEWNVSKVLTCLICLMVQNPSMMTFLNGMCQRLKT